MYLDAVTLKQLRALAAVARHGSLSGAAQALRLTPPAVHSQIRGLESAFGVALLQRASDTAGSQLTVEGSIILDAAERIEIALNRAGQQVTAVAQGQMGRVTVGVVSTAKYFAPRLIKTLKTLCPEIEVALRVGNRYKIIRDLELQAVDIAIMGRPPRAPQVEAVPVGPHPHSLLAAPDHPLAGVTALSAADLRNETFLSREEGSGTRILMTRYLDRIGDGQIFNLVVMDSNETIKQAVAAGLGIAFLSLHTVQDELQSGRLLTLAAPQLPIERHWFLVHPSVMPLRPAAQRVHEAITGLRGTFLPRSI